MLLTASTNRLGASCLISVGTNPVSTDEEAAGMPENCSASFGTDSTRIATRSTSRFASSRSHAPNSLL